MTHPENDTIQIPAPRLRPSQRQQQQQQRPANRSNNQAIDQSNIQSSDQIVIGTSDDAAVSKMSCVNLGYYADPDLPYFVSKHAISRRPPLINRGYYARVAAVQTILNDFLSAKSDQSNNQRQIISIGAGSDTNFFRLVRSNQMTDCVRYVEVDFPSAIVQKAAIIHSKPELYSMVDPSFNQSNNQSIPDPHTHPDSLPSNPVFVYDRLSLVGADLRNLDQLDQAINQAGIDRTLPTLFLAECVLIYMPAVDTDRLINWSSNQFTGGSVFVSYEQIHPFDPFGQTMITNLIARGCPLLGYNDYPTIEAHQKRYHSLGYSRYQGADMNDIYRLKVDRTEIKRIERLELFDEFEEWHLIQAHYHISLASKGAHPCTMISLIPGIAPVTSKETAT